jgi:hypothetical protein
LRDHQVRIVLVRDPAGKRHDEAFFCTDVAASPSFVLEGYARRWTIEVTFHDSKQFLGFAHPESQSARAVARTAPMALVVYHPVLFWSAAEARQGRTPSWGDRPWYRTKTAPSFPDLLTALRHASWQAGGPAPISSPSAPASAPPKSPGRPIFPAYLQAA